MELFESILCVLFLQDVSKVLVLFDSVYRFISCGRSESFGKLLSRNLFTCGLSSHDTRLSNSQYYCFLRFVTSEKTVARRNDDPYFLLSPT